MGKVGWGKQGLMGVVVKYMGERGVVAAWQRGRRLGVGEGLWGHMYTLHSSLPG